MEFNIQKCKVMHIGHSNPGHKYLMDNQYLQEVSDEKDLGIMITSDLKSVAQVMEASKKAKMISVITIQNNLCISTLHGEYSFG